MTPPPCLTWTPPPAGSGAGSGYRSDAAIRGAGGIGSGDGRQPQPRQGHGVLRQDGARDPQPARVARLVRYVAALCAQTAV